MSRNLILLYALCLIDIVLLLSQSPVLGVTTPFPDAIADLKDAIVKGLDFQSEDIVVTGFDPNEALMGHSVAYEFDIEVDDKVLPVKLLEDVKRWEYVDLPIVRAEGDTPSSGLEEPKRAGSTFPVLAPFQLAGPMEIWIQDAQDMRLSLPHDVDAGILKKVILAQGAVVTVKGARSVTLRHPITLPLPLNRTRGAIASLAEHLRHASLTSESPLLSLRIVGPTSLTSPSPSSSTHKLKLKRLAPGFVELSSHPKPQPFALPAMESGEPTTTTVLTPNYLHAMWPLSSLNVSHPNLLGFEKLLVSVMGPKGKEKGFFKLLRADVSAETYVKIGFGVEKKVREGEGYPEWRSRPERVRMHFEVLGKVEGKKVIPERVVQVDPLQGEDTLSQTEALGNLSMSSSLPLIHSPPSPFTL